MFQLNSYPYDSKENFFNSLDESPKFSPFEIHNFNQNKFESSPKMTYPQLTPFKVEVFDYDFAVQDDSSGSVDLNIKDCPLGVISDKWYPLTYNNKISGQIHLILHHCNSTDIPFENNEKIQKFEENI